MGAPDKSVELLSAQARAELLMFASLSVDEGVLLIAQMYGRNTLHGTDDARQEPEAP